VCVCSSSHLRHVCVCVCVNGISSWVFFVEFVCVKGILRGFSSSSLCVCVSSSHLRRVCEWDFFVGFLRRVWVCVCVCCGCGCFFLVSACVCFVLFSFSFVFFCVPLVL
jgi:hypothetical protein